MGAPMDVGETAALITLSHEESHYCKKIKIKKIQSRNEHGTIFLRESFTRNTVGIAVRSFHFLWDAFSHPHHFILSSLSSLSICYFRKPVDHGLIECFTPFCSLETVKLRPGKKVEWKCFKICLTYYDNLFNHFACKDLHVHQRDLSNRQSLKQQRIVNHHLQMTICFFFMRTMCVMCVYCRWTI